MLPILAGLALATLLSEDLTCIAAGVLIALRRLQFVEGTFACLAGIFAGDMMLIWTPILAGATTLLGEEVLRRILAQTSQSLAAFSSIAVMAAIALRILKPLFDPAGRRRIVGWGLRALRWEFWPPWLAYLPLLPYLAFLMIRYRSATLFTCTNPGIPSGGFAGESKSQILSNLSAADSAVAEFALIAGDLPFTQRLQAALQFMRGRNLNFPIVLKPDLGERGSGVAVIRTTVELETYLRTALGDTIIQRYIDGAEFGVFYYRHPGEGTGNIFSITEKHFPYVTGDGVSSLRDLILNDSRAVCLADVYEKSAKRQVNSVPRAGERVPLVELGSHCRGAVFLDGMRLKTAAMEQAIERISRSYPGFFFGRFDIRTPSVELFQQGEGFYVIELNGVSAEATHIYDPSVSLITAYRVLYRQWKIAFEIGAANRMRGSKSMALADLITLIARWASRRPQLPVNERPH